MRWNCSISANASQDWDAFVIENAQKDSGFLQSAGWAQVQKEFGHDPVFFQWKENEKIVMQLVGFIQPWYLGKKFFYIPRGPIGKPNQALLIQVLEDIKSFAKEKGFVCVEMDASFGVVLPPKTGWKKGRETRQPLETLILNLSLSEEELLAQMKQKTRYNIRVAEKNGVRVERRQDEKALDIFLGLLKKTSERKGFGLHEASYYKQIFDSDLDTSIYIAWHDDVPVAAHFVIWFGAYAVYLHGGSDEQHRALMAPNLLQWQEIQDAKQAGKKFYDFWGIASEGRKKDAWAGFTRFKRGFAPDVQPIRYEGNFVFIRRIFLYCIIGILKYIVLFLRKDPSHE